jgi:hypothetical protein
MKMAKKMIVKKSASKKTVAAKPSKKVRIAARIAKMEARNATATKKIAYRVEKIKALKTKLADL